jgi:hypothetical protein
MPCCGRPSNRANKNNEAAYYERYAYLSKEQRARQIELIGSTCATCDALTASAAGNKCSICGNPKEPKPND